MFHAQNGVETEPCSEGGMNLTEVGDGDWVKVVGVDFGEGATRFNAGVASDAAGGTIEIRIDRPDGWLLGVCKLSDTGGWQEWQVASCEVNGVADVHDLYLTFTGEGDQLANVDYWQFER